MTHKNFFLQHLFIKHKGHLQSDTVKCLLFLSFELFIILNLLLQRHEQHAKKMTITKLMSTKKSSIQITIQMDERNIPEQIQWLSEDQTIPSAQDAKAMMLALWDKQSRNGMSVDLWTKEMTIEEMNLFVFQTLMTMSDTFERATRNSQEAASLRTYANAFLKSVQETQTDKS